MAPNTIISHPRTGEPDVKLEDHLQDVRSRMLDLGQFDGSGTCSERRLVTTIALLHDFGKVTPAFQSKIHGEFHGPPQQTYHARLGALAAFWVIREIGGETTDALAAFTAISRHHGALPDIVKHVRDDVYEPETDEDDPMGWATEQVRSIEQHPKHAQTASELLVLAGDETTTWDEFACSMTSGQLYEMLADTVSEDVGYGYRQSNFESLPPRLYDRTLKYWGHLTLADKTSAADIALSNLKRTPLSLDPLETHIESIEGADELEQDLNVWRERARTTAPKNAVERLLDGEADVGRLTLPTGLGKTFTGITTAFTLRDEIASRRQLNEKPTVVYALPFTSIIEQTREIFEDPDIWGADPAGHDFTVHHYLSETVTRVNSEVGDSGSAETDEWTHADAMLGEGWRSGTVLTTFVQLFESLAGPTNSQGLKFSALQDAVIILDEPQALPKRWWAAIPRLLKTLRDEFGATVVAMTATQPALFSAANDLETVELLDDVDEYYDRARRVRYTIDDSVWELGNPDVATTTPIDHETAGRRIVDEFTEKKSETSPGGSALAVCNTIASSRRLTETVQQVASTQVEHIGQVYREILDGQGHATVSHSQNPHNESHDGEERANHLAAVVLRELGFTPEPGQKRSEYSSVTDTSWVWSHSETPPLFLATFNSRYRPKDRRVLLRLADVLTTTEAPFVLVATQAVEAGVDLSFARVYRDLAPLDSVVQAAGRCNRSFEWGIENGQVTVWFLADPEEPDGGIDRTPASYVYGDGIGGHLGLIAGALWDTLNRRTDVDELQLTREAVPTYFERIQEKAFASQELVEYIDHSEAKQLGRKSLIQEDYPTVDILVAVTEQEVALVEQIGDAFGVGNLPDAYELLQQASELRISIPARDADTALGKATRVDRKERGSGDGVQILRYTPKTAGGSYNLDGGGFVADDDDVIAGRFTVL